MTILVQKYLGSNIKQTQIESQKDMEEQETKNEL